MMWLISFFTGISAKSHFCVCLCFGVVKRVLKRHVFVNKSGRAVSVQMPQCVCVFAFLFHILADILTLSAPELPECIMT